MAAAGLLGLAGCATQAPPPAAPVAPAAPPAVTAAQASEAQALAALEARHIQAAATAEQQAAWPQALAAMDVLIALRPGDGELAARRTRAEQAAQAAAADRIRRARQAQQRGDNDGAQRLFLEALAQDPGQAEAAEALRTLERDRLRRTVLAAPLRAAPGGRGTSVAARTEAGMGPAGVAPAAPAVDRNELEHASLLAAHGELDSAIALLRPMVAAPGADPAARSLLAEVYVRRAEGLLPGDRAGAIAALEKAVQADATHPRAAPLLRQLKGGGK